MLTSLLLATTLTIMVRPVQCFASANTVAQRFASAKELSDIVAGEDIDSIITWADTQVTAFRCDLVEFSGPSQVIHEAPIENNNIEINLYGFDGVVQGSYRLDNYDADINQIIQDTGGVQASRVNAASMLVDWDFAKSNYPLAAFVFDPDDLQSSAQPAYLCRFDAVHLECFDTPLLTRGLNSAIPFVGKVVVTTYFYANGLAVDDIDPLTNVRTTRPLFLVHNVNEDLPDFDPQPYYVNRVGNVAMRCADLTSFEIGVCFDDDGMPSQCVTTNDLNGVSSVVPSASFFLTCISLDAVGIILIALDDTQTPLAYNFVEGIDVSGSSDFFLPVPDPNDDSKAERQLLENGQRVGAFGGCYAVRGDIIAALNPSLYCSSNAGLGLYQIDLPIEMGYCEDTWTTFDLNDDGTTMSESCKRFEPTCPECSTQRGKKPLIIRVADSPVTNRNDGLNCDQTLFTPPPPVVPTPMPSPAPSPEPTKHKPLCKGFKVHKDVKRYCWKYKGLFDRPYRPTMNHRATRIKLTESHGKYSVSWHWWGVVEMPRSGKIKFKTTSSDGSQVWLFDKGEGLKGERPDTSGASLLVDNTAWRPRGSPKSVTSKWIRVKKGEKRVMHVFYGQKSHRYTKMILRWKYEDTLFKTNMKPFFPCHD